MKTVDLLPVITKPSVKMVNLANISSTENSVSYVYVLPVMVTVYRHVY